MLSYVSYRFGLWTFSSPYIIFRDLDTQSALGKECKFHSNFYFSGSCWDIFTQLNYPRLRGNNGFMIKFAHT